jgi:hypothetical protein
MGEERKVYKILVGKPQGNRDGRMGSVWMLGRSAGEWGVVDSFGSG